jgi:hypothetical protein
MAALTGCISGRWMRPLTLGAASLLLSCPAGAAPLEGAVKAAYLFKMAAFVTWPPTALGSATSPFRICVLNRNDVAAPIAELTRGQQAWGRTISIAHLSSASDPVLNQCQILFLGGARAQISDSAAVLTVTDKGAPTPGVVEFSLEQGHVRFVIHRTQADVRRLAISSKLLSVAQAVVP